MKHPASLKIVGIAVVLVPYRDCHVPRYHDWMQDAEILRLTGSEPLSLEEEFGMQKKWTEDPDSKSQIML